jgi:hypothetical protein
VFVGDKTRSGQFRPRRRQQDCHITAASPDADAAEKNPRPARVALICGVYRAGQRATTRFEHFEAATGTWSRRARRSSSRPALPCLRSTEVTSQVEQFGRQTATRWFRL